MYFLTCAGNSENLLAKELTEMGAEKIKASSGGVFFDHQETTFYYNVNLRTRIGFRVLKPVLEFYAANENAIYNSLVNFEWNDYFSCEKSILIQSNIRNSSFDHAHYLSLKAKDAICDFFRSKYQQRPDIDKNAPEIVINIFINKNQCAVSLDSSGKSLNKRGYRLNHSKAALRETVAATLIKLMKWEDTIPFYDLMCGSGTIPIEAFLIGRNIAPGLLNPSFSFQNWNMYDSSTFDKIIKNLKSEINNKQLMILAGDKSKKNIESAIKNSDRAGIENSIQFHTGDFFDFVPEQKGYLILNPPYGERLQTKVETFKLFQEMNLKLKKDFKGFKVGILSPNLDDLKQIKMTPEKIYKVYNGNLLCNFVIFKVF